MGHIFAFYIQNWHHPHSLFITFKFACTSSEKKKIKVTTAIPQYFFFPQRKKANFLPKPLRNVKKIKECHWQSPLGNDFRSPTENLANGAMRSPLKHLTRVYTKDISKKKRQINFWQYMLKQIKATWRITSELMSSQTEIVDLIIL